MSFVTRHILLQGTALSREDILQYALQDLLGYNTEETQNPGIYTARKLNALGANLTPDLFKELVGTLQALRTKKTK